MGFIEIVIAVALGVAFAPAILRLLEVLGWFILIAVLLVAWFIISNVRPEWITNAGYVVLVAGLLLVVWFAIPERHKDTILEWITNAGYVVLVGYYLLMALGILLLILAGILLLGLELVNS